MFKHPHECVLFIDIHSLELYHDLPIKVYILFSIHDSGADFFTNGFYRLRPFFTVFQSKDMVKSFIAERKKVILAHSFKINMLYIIFKPGVELGMHHLLIVVQFEVF